MPSNVKNNEVKKDERTAGRERSMGAIEKSAA